MGFAKGATIVALIIPILILAIPIMDTFFAIIRRLIEHKPIMQPDKGTCTTACWPRAFPQANGFDNLRYHDVYGLYCHFDAAFKPVGAFAGGVGRIRVGTSLR